MAVAGYLDHLSNLTADMVLGALIDAGVDPDDLAAAMKQRHGVDCEINVATEQAGGTPVTRVSLSYVEATVPESYRDMPKEGTGTPAAVLLDRVIGHLEKNVSELRGTLEQTPTEEVVVGRHATVRILALCNALGLLGIESLYHEALPFAAGVESTPPLQAALMRGAAIRPTDGASVDLAGCAVLTALSAGPLDRFGFTLRKAGYGGTGSGRDSGDLIRLCIGDVGRPADRESVRVLETQIDDMNPQFYSHVIDRLLEAGALDAYLTPVIMKKTRPGVLLTVLSPPVLAGRLSEVIFTETTTIGLRSYSVSRSVLPRSEAAVETPYGAVRIKVVRHGDARRYTPEFEDCRLAALRAGIPLADVYAAVHEAAGRLDLDSLP